MKYLLLVVFAIGCSPKNYRMDLCLRTATDICNTVLWPFTKEECIEQSKTEYRKDNRFIYSCRKVEK